MNGGRVHPCRTVRIGDCAGTGWQKEKTQESCLLIRYGDKGIVDKPQNKKNEECHVLPFLSGKGNVIFHITGLGAGFSLTEERDMGTASFGPIQLKGEDAA
ncbi:hypothetical protein GDO81_002022 [Engystomops pustulosus]|uniref:Uncharacterized protein n=1 Tax=Engystomops pustulosus TaxID=76066 RepID=A0AAV7DGS5_ENGPU|nr:hypothetical protein GDO81_002022 [Engystomops pustulosus]